MTEITPIPQSPEINQQFQRAREVAARYEGVLNENDPGEYGQAIGEVVDWHNRTITQLATADVGTELDLQVDIQQQAREGRPEYHQKVPQEIQQHIDTINTRGVANIALVDLNEAADLREAAEVGLRSVNIGVAIPCMPAEATTAGEITDYVLETIQDPKRVLVINARDDQGIRDAVKERVPMISQNDVLEEIDWQQMIADGIIPHHFPLHRNEHGLLVPDTGVGVIHRKGMTMYAGQLMFMAMQQAGLLPEDRLRYIGHDGDITNPRQYQALHYLGLGFLQDPDGMPNILRSGPGRNNEPWIQGTNQLKLNAALAMRRRALIEKNHLTPMERKYVEKIHQENGVTGQEIDVLMAMGYSLGAWGWPLTGEREFDPTLVTSSGMDLETTYAVNEAVYDIMNRTRRTVQVCNPNPKLENGASSPQREFSLIGGCANWQQALVEFSLKINRMPHEWGMAEINIFNKLYGGNPVPISVRSDKEDQPNTVTMSNLGFMLPSAQFLLASEYINGDNVTQKYYDRNKHIIQ